MKRILPGKVPAIREMGFEHLLLVTGEHQAKVGMDYFRRRLPALREQFSSLQMEVQPLAETEYAELKQLGLDGVMVYQETYHEATYARHHLKGKKQDFFWRLETPDRLGRAGIDRIRPRRANWPFRQLARAQLYGCRTFAMAATALLAKPLLCLLSAPAPVYWRH